MKPSKVQLQEMHEISQTMIAGKERLLEIFKEFELDDSILWKSFSEMGLSDCVRLSFFIKALEEED